MSCLFRKFSIKYELNKFKFSVTVNSEYSLYKRINLHLKCKKFFNVLNVIRILNFNYPSV